MYSFYNIMNCNNSVRRKRIILRLFPYLDNINDAEKIQIDNDSIHYISSREYAKKISDIIMLHLKMINISADNTIITDATAGVGGDTISFCKHFKYVNAIEIDTLRSKYLANNAQIYKCNNVNIINGSCVDVLPNLDDHNVIFFDPPWEPENMGSYKQYTDLKLPFCGKPLELFCNNLINPTFMKKVPELFVLKLPVNYDIIHFFKNTNNKKIYYYNLGKMIILVIDNSQL